MNTGGSSTKAFERNSYCGPMKPSGSTPLSLNKEWYAGSNAGQIARYMYRWKNKPVKKRADKGEKWHTQRLDIQLRFIRKQLLPEKSGAHALINGRSDLHTQRLDYQLCLISKLLPGKPVAHALIIKTSGLLENRDLVGRLCYKDHMCSAHMWSLLNRVKQPVSQKMRCQRRCPFRRLLRRHRHCPWSSKSPWMRNIKI